MPERVSTRACRAIIVFLTLLSVSASPGQNSQPEGLPLRAVHFTGNHHFPDALLKEQVFQLAPGGLQRLIFWRKPPAFRENLLQRDVTGLVRFYQREGFLGIRISPDIENQAGGDVVLTYDIAEGARVIIDSVTIQALDDEETVRRVLQKAKLKLTSKPGNGFRDEDVQADMAALTTAFTNEGYAYARMLVRPLLSADQLSARIIYEISPGPACYFGPVTIHGDTLIRPATLQRQIAFKPEQRYSQEKLQKTQRQIYQLGIYQFVTVKVAMDTTPERILPVSVQLRAAPAWTIKLGAGYSYEDRFRTFVDLRKLNFLHGARRLNLYLKYSYLEPWHVDIKMTQAAFPGPSATLIFNPFFRRQREPGFTIDRTGANVAYQQRFATNTDGFLRYTLEQNYLKVSSMTREQALDSSNIALYQKSTVTLGMARDNSLPIFNPQKGLFTAATLTWTGIGFRSDFHYFKLLLEGRHYRKLRHTLILATRIKFGSMQPLRQDRFTPIEDRFYAGGSNSVRGWPYAGLGPKSSSNAPLGGNSLLELGSECRFPLIGPFSGVLFLDLGNVWSRVNGQRLDQLQAAAGTGLRYRTPIGPIRLDFGWPLAAGNLPMQVHLSIGQAF